MCDLIFLKAISNASGLPIPQGLYDDAVRRHKDSVQAARRAGRPYRIRDEIPPGIWTQMLNQETYTGFAYTREQVIEELSRTDPKEWWKVDREIRYQNIVKDFWTSAAKHNLQDQVTFLADLIDEEYGLLEGQDRVQVVATAQSVSSFPQMRKVVTQLDDERRERLSFQPISDEDEHERFN